MKNKGQQIDFSANAAPISIQLKGQLTEEQLIDFDGLALAILVLDRNGIITKYEKIQARRRLQIQINGALGYSK